MISPARASLHRKLSALAAGSPSGLSAPAMPETGPIATEYQLLLAALGVDLRQLSEIQSIERKVEAKRVMIDRYRPWVDGALETGAAGQAVQDEIVVTMLIWALDIADWPLALEIGNHVLNHHLALPERYKRNPATLIAEQVAEAGLRTPAEVDADTLILTDRLTGPHDMHDQVRAKLLKALGLAFQHLAETFDPNAETARAGGKGALLGTALEHYQAALGKDAKVGVKKSIEWCERELRKLTADPAT